MTKKLPNGWEFVNLGEVSEIIMGQSPPSSTYNKENNGLPFFQGKTDFGRRHPKIRMYCADPKKTARKNDILMSVRAPVGPVNIATDDCCIGRGLCAIRSSDKLDLMYLYHFLKVNEIKISSKGTGSTFTAINKKTVHELEIPLPPLPTQAKIVAILEKTERLREWRREADKLTDEFLKSTFLDMFGDPVKNPKGWEITELKTEIKDIRYGTGSPPEYKKEGIPFIRATNIKKGTVQKKGLVYISKEEASKIKKCKIKTGDLILVRSGINTGDCARIPPDYDGAYAAYDLIIQIPYPKNYYYNFIINSEYGKSVIKPLSRRAAQPHINADQVKSLQFHLPPAQLLEKFASIVQHVEQIRQHQEQSKQQIDHFFNTLMQRAFRGELEA